MTFTYTPEQAEKLAARWNALANDDNQISAGEVHHIFGDNADHDIFFDQVTIVEVRASQSVTGAPATFHVTRDEVNPPKYVATISHHSIARAPYSCVGDFFDTLHAAKINATREFGDGYLDHVIKIIEVTDGEGEVVASRRVGDKRWSTL